MRFWIALLLVVLAFAWTTTLFTIQLIGGSWTSAIPLTGLTIILWYAGKGFVFFVKEPKTVFKICNLIINLGTPLKAANERDPQRTDELLDQLTVPPQQFKVQLGL